MYGCLSTHEPSEQPCWRYGGTKQTPDTRTLNRYDNIKYRRNGKFHPRKVHRIKIVIIFVPYKLIIKCLTTTLFSHYTPFVLILTETSQAHLRCFLKNRGGFSVRFAVTDAPAAPAKTLFSTVAAIRAARQSHTAVTYTSATVFLCAGKAAQIPERILSPLRNAFTGMSADHSHDDESFLTLT